MDAKIKPKSIRKAILMALADGAIVTIDDLQTKVDEPRTKVANNAHAALADSLIKRLRDDVTGNPAYQITAKGREYLANFSGTEEPPEIAEKAGITLGVKTDGAEAAVVREYQTTEEALLTVAAFCAELDDSTRQRHEGVALCVLEDAMPGFTAEVMAQKDAVIANLQKRWNEALSITIDQSEEIARITSQRDAWRDAIGEISGEDTPQSAAQFISELKGRVGGINSRQEEKAQREIADLRNRMNHITLMLRNSSAEALASEDSIEMLLANVLHATAHQSGPVGFVVQRPIKPMLRFTKPEKAQAHALSLARLGQRAQVFALHPVGNAVPGAEWRPA